MNIQNKFFSMIFLSLFFVALGLFAPVDDALSSKCMNKVDCEDGSCCALSDPTAGTGDKCTSAAGCYADQSRLYDLSVCLIQPKTPVGVACSQDGSDYTNPVGGLPPVYAQIPEWYSQCTESKCDFDTASPDGAKCLISVKGKAGNANMNFYDDVQKNASSWDASEKKCMYCLDSKIETAVCGDEDGTYVQWNGSVLQCLGGSPNGLCESGCSGTSSQCDEKSPLGTVDIPVSLPDIPIAGTCEGCIFTPSTTGGLTLTASASRTDIQATEFSTITFTVKDGSGNPVNGAVVNSINIDRVGPTLDITSCTTVNGKCVVEFTSIAGSAGTYKISSDNATFDGDETLGAFVSISISSCTGGVTSVPVISASSSAVTFGGAAYGSKNIICLYDPSDSKVDSVQVDIGGIETKTYPQGGFGIWTATSESGTSCPSSPGNCRMTDSVTDDGNSGGCIPSWSGWSAATCSAGSQSQTRSDSNSCFSDETRTESCCATSADCAGSSTGPICNPAGNGKCVACMTNDDCLGDLVCNVGSNVCEPCSGEGVSPAAQSMCCKDLDYYWDKDQDGNKECTTSCDSSTGYFCNSVRNTVDGIVQSGESMIRAVLGIVGSLTLLLMIISGTMYITAVGNEEKIVLSKKILTGAAIGLGIVLLSFSLLQAIIVMM